VYQSDVYCVNGTPAFKKIKYFAKNYKATRVIYPQIIAKREDPISILPLLKLVKL